MSNLATLLIDRRDRHPDRTIGVVGEQIRLETAVGRGMRVCKCLLDIGLRPGDRLAVVGETSTDFLVFWMGCQLAGISPALINPRYPVRLIGEIIRDLDPVAVASTSGDDLDGNGATCIGLAALGEGRMRIGSRLLALPDSGEAAPPGLERDELDCAGFMHTSGTTGRPKLCSQSHRYFLSLGQYVADFIALSPADRVFAPLPMFHINPLGYGLMGALTAGASLAGLERLKPEKFWHQVKATGSTALILHAPPVQVLLKRTSADDAAGHRVRTMFYADAHFLDRFGIPMAAAGYGSTEAGGLTHMRMWHRGAAVPGDTRVAMGCWAGTARPGIDWMLTEGGELRVRSRTPGILFDGYWHDGRVVPQLADDGWFDTGDLGRRFGDELVFLQRQSESIRVRGEFVPIEYVERHIAGACPELEIALWKDEGWQSADERPILYVAGGSLPADRLHAAIAVLPPFMRPAEAIRIDAIPIDETTGKVRRRLLKAARVAESVEL